jgi:putative membrane-bound dehydrogenase-like protein
MPKFFAAGLFSVLLFVNAAAGADDERVGNATVSVGAAKVDVTPEYPVRLSGYGSRRAESEGVAQKLWVKALAIGGDDGDGPAVLLTLDNCGVTTKITETVAARLKEKAGVRRERIVICVSHSHTAPCLTDWAPFIFGSQIPDEHQQHIDRYTGEVTDKLTQVALEALANRRPARLSWGTGKVGFAVNRRVLKDGVWGGFGVQSDGPVDHSLPILAAKDNNGKLIAVLANYACHCTTLGGDFNQICGDWSGYAQEYIEEANPGAVSLITIGCGADANPNPRASKLELCQQHGRALADEVQRLLKTQLTPLDPRLDCRLTHVELPFDTLPTKEQWQEKAKQAGAPGYHAQQFLARLERGEQIPKTLSYPMGTWTFGKDLAMVFLGGEVVVDYAMRMKEEFDSTKLWITAYSNDVVCYIPSKRILREGGYEADYSMIYYARPTRFADDVEQIIIDAVQKLLPQWFYAAPKQADFPPPKSPDESLAAIKVRPGMKVELVAAEPLVVDPVAFDWGPDGRLWVVEMSDYPNGMSWQREGDPVGKAAGRVKVLEDTDGDGRYDKATLFLDEIPFPTGVKVWRGGVLVTAAPLVFYAEDTDGDGKADKRETLYEGFGEGNQQHRVNGLRWGLDNWIYVGNGDSGGTIKSLKTGDVVNVSGRDLRIRPDAGLIDAQSGQTQFGRCRDDWGNWFGGNNSNPMWHYVLEDHYLRRNPHVAPPEIRKQVSVQPGASPVFPISRTLARFNDFDKLNRFTSACSPEIYRDELFQTVGWVSDPSILQSVAAAAEDGRVEDGRVGDPSYSFVCEPVHNLVHCEVVTPAGVTFTSRRLDDEQQSEFLASTDNWFRPSMCRTGPDGALWIADMYRFVIEHPKWIPADWQRKLELRAGDDMGRIYRVVPANQAPRAMPRLDKLDTAGLVAALDSPNGWQRDMAQQMLLWKNDKTAVAPLETMAASAERATARLHALCTLDGLGALRAEIVSRALADNHLGVRRHAVRLSEPLLNDDPRLGKQLVAMCDDADPLVRLQVAYSLGFWADVQAGHALGTLALRSHDDPYQTAAVMSSLNKGNLGGALSKVLAASSVSADRRAAQSLLTRLLGMAAALKDDAAVAQALAAVTQPESPQRYAAWQLGALAELMDVAGREKRTNVDQLLDDHARGQVAAMFAQARQMAADAQTAEADRLSAVRLLGRGPDNRNDDLQTLGKLLGPRNPLAIQTAAIDALGRLGDASAAEQLLADWNSHTPAVRSQVLDSLLGRADWTNELLAAVQSQRIAAAHIDARRRQQFSQHKDAAIRARAAALFGSATSSDRQQVLEQFRDAVSLPGDLTRGKEIFGKRCAACHRMEGVGHLIGPDLAALTDKSPAAMLVAVLDPNRAVEDKFLDYIAVTDDGRQMTGILTAETGNSITLTGQEGKQTVVLRNQLEELRSTGKSLMPEGVEKDVTPQDLADVFAYLRGSAPPPKQFPGNKPEVAHVRDDGSIHLLAISARIYGPTLVFEEKYRNLGWWQNVEDHAIWTLNVPTAGTYRVTLDYACADSAAADSFVLTVAGQTLGGRVEGTDTWDNYRSKDLGPVQLPAGPAELLFRSDGPIKSALIDLRGIRLVPVR